MSKLIIICSSGVTSQMVADALQTKLNKKGYDVTIDNTNTNDAPDVLAADEHDFYLVSPQASYMLKKLAQMTEKPIIGIPPRSYTTADFVIEDLAAFVIKAFDLQK